MATYLDFEQKIRNLQDDIESALMRGDDDAKHILEKELEKEVANVYANISDYQRLQLARHPDRPYAMDYIELICKDGPAPKPYHGSSPDGKAPHVPKAGSRP